MLVPLYSEYWVDPTHIPQSEHTVPSQVGQTPAHGGIWGLGCGRGGGIGLWEGWGDWAVGGPDLRPETLPSDSNGLCPSLRGFGLYVCILSHTEASSTKRGSPVSAGRFITVTSPFCTHWEVSC